METSGRNYGAGSVLASSLEERLRNDAYVVVVESHANTSTSIAQNKRVNRDMIKDIEAPSEMLLVTNSRGGIPQVLHETESLDVMAMARRLRKSPLNVSIVNHAELLKIDPASISGRFIVYASAQYLSFFQYIEDCLLYAHECGGILVPRFVLFRSHENKFMQELVKKLVRIPDPPARLVGTMEDLEEVLPTLHYPVILKQPAGFGSVGVTKIDSEQELKRLVKSSLTQILPAASNFLRRMRQKAKRDVRLEMYKDVYPLRAGRLVLQEYIPDLVHDWKVLVFGDTCFCLKRFVRPGDFRASGSGNFTFDDEPSTELLDYALDAARKLDTPWVSLDIAESASGFALIEFQCVHFGLYTLTNNTRNYSNNGSGWISTRVRNPVPEDYFCDALLKYLSRHVPY